MNTKLPERQSNQKPNHNFNIIEFFKSEEIRGKVITLFAGIAIASAGSLFASSSKTISMAIMFIGCATTAAAVEQIIRAIPKDR